MKDSKHKYKILMLSDLRKSTTSTLKSAISLAKIINGDIEFFCVRKPTEIIEKDNQLSAIREINKNYIATETKIKKLIKTVSDSHGVNVNYKLVYGNVKGEIDNYISEYQPDIIVLGKRNSNSFNFIGDNLTQFVLNKYNGVIMISANNNVLEPYRELSIGFLNPNEKSFNVDIAEDLLNHTQQPLKSFQFVKNSELKNKKQLQTDKELIEYVFEQNDNVLDHLSGYVSKSNINLLCIDRSKQKASNKANQSDSSIENVIKKLNVSMLVFGE